MNALQHLRDVRNLSFFFIAEDLLAIYEHAKIARTSGFDFCRYAEF